MSTFVNDTFTGAADGDNLATHVGEIGAAWTLLNGTDAKLTASGDCYPAGTGVTRASGVAISADYSVFGEFWNAGGTEQPIGLFARLNNSSTLDGIVVRFGTSTQLLAFRYNSGTPTQLGATTTITALPNDSGVTKKILELRLAGTNVQVWWDGTKVIDVTDASVPSRIGLVAVRTAGAATTTTGYRASRFWAVDSAPTDTITGTDLVTSKVYQRTVGTTAKSLTLAGTYGGSPDNIQYRISPFGGGTPLIDWTAFSSFGSGIFSQSISITQGGPYRYELRTRNVTGDILATWSGTSSWSVGVLIAAGGQSNLPGYGDANYTVADSHVVITQDGVTWAHLADPWLGGAGASMLPSLGNKLYTDLGCPIGFIPVASLGAALIGSDGTVWDYRNPANHSDTSTLYGKLLAHIIAAGGCEFFLFNQGATDAVNGATQTAYTTALNDMVSMYTADLGVKPKWFLNEVGRSHVAGSFDAGYNAVRMSHRAFDNGTDQFCVSSTMDFTISNPDLLGGNTSHYDGTSQAILGVRYAIAIEYSLGLVAHYGSPRLSSALFTTSNKTIIRVTLIHRGGTDFTPTSSIPGFTVIDANGTKTVSAARVDGTHIDVTATTPCVGTTAVYYEYGKNPSGPTGLLVDNQSTGFPFASEGAGLAIIGGSTSNFLFM